MIVIFKEFTWRISLIFFSASLDIKNRSGKIYFIFWSFRKLKNQNLFIYLFILLIYLFFSEVYPYKYITQDNLLGYTWWCNLMNISELDFKSKKVLDFSKRIVRLVITEIVTSSKRISDVSSVLQYQKTNENSSLKFLKCLDRVYI